MKLILSKGKITELVSDSGQGGRSGEAYLVKHNGNKWLKKSKKYIN